MKMNILGQMGILLLETEIGEQPRLKKTMDYPVLLNISLLTEVHTVALEVCPILGQQTPPEKD